MDTNLLATKLLIPPSSHHTVRRERLIDALEHEMPTARLVLVSAPAGYGKTTLLTQWARSSRHAVAWLTCGDGDNDLMRFLRYVLSAWDRVQPGMMESHLGLILGDVSPDLDRVQGAFIALAGDLPGHLAIVLDDFQVIDNPVIHETLAFLIDHSPPSLHFVLASRGDPRFSLSRLRARGELLELRIADLQLRPEESLGLLAEAGVPELTPARTDALHRKVEGWAAGLQLMALTLRNRPETPDRVTVSGRHRHIADYLGEEVLTGLNEDTRRFLLQTSILERLSGPLCAHVTDTPHSQDMLESLERAGLFLMPLDDHRTWFRYHGLFADFLRERLSRTVGLDTGELHRKAARWHLDHDLPEQAFDHALAGDDVATVIEIVHRYLTAKLFSGEVRVGTRWMQAIPARWKASSPDLQVEEAAFFLISGQREAGIRRLEQAERTSQESSPWARHTIARVKAMRCFISCYSNNLTDALHFANQAFQDLAADDVEYRVNLYHALGDTYRGNGRWREATSHYLKALELSSEQPRAPATRHLPVHVYGAMADLELRQGHIREAASFWMKALALVEDREHWGRVPLPVTGWVYLRIGELHYEWNDLAKAWEFISQGLERAELGGDARATIAGKIILSHLEIASSRTEEADAHLDEARILLEATPFPDWTSRLERCRVRLWLARDDLRSAVSWSDAMLTSGELDRRPDAAVAWLAIAHSLIRKGDRDSLTQAVTLLKRLHADAATTGQTGVLIDAGALMALARERQGGHPAALTELERALRLAEPEGYVRLFVDLGLPMRWLLREARNRGVMPDYVSRLLAAFGEHADTGSSRSAALLTIEPLSTRELDVLRLIAAGLTNREIAEALFVSPETVKKHTGNIYGKLGVHNRVEAVTRARALTIID